jgi:hypothetical protein
MRGLIILIGECFREGHSTSRLRDTENSYIPQKDASESHYRFLNHIKINLGIDVDLIINTYDTKFEEDLKSWYGDFLIEYNSNENIIGMQNLLNNITKKIDKDAYDFVFAIRIDIFLKELFFEKFNPNWNRITFSQICWTKLCRVANNEPRIGDVIIFIPKRLFYLFDRYIYLWHDSWINYKYNYHLTNNDLNLMIDTYHDSDTEKDWNPLYYMVSRAQSNVWHSEGYKLDMNTFEGPY